jgi:hypothetical protein
MRMIVIVRVSAGRAEVRGLGAAPAVRMGVAVTGGLHVVLVLHEMLIDGNGDHHGEHEEYRDDERTARTPGAVFLFLFRGDVFHADDLLSRERHFLRNTDSIP